MKGSKRAHKSDSSDSENVTPTKGSPTRTFESTTNKKLTKAKSSVSGVASVSHLNSTLKEMNPVVLLDRVSIPQSLRKSLGHGVGLSPLVSVRNESDDREREERHRQRIAAQRRSLHSSASTPDKRKSANNAAQIFNPDQLKEHYSVCIKLSATNKITTKNAFVLHLIDYMSDFLKNTNDGQMNFKLASSTLDAGAKIYCNRVDCVHAEAQKVASGLVMAFDKKTNDRGQTEDEGDEDGDGIVDTETGPRPKKKKVVKHSGKTLVQNVDTINISKFEGNLEIDPLFHHISSGFDMGSVNCLLTANLRINDNYQLILDSGGRINDNASSVRSNDVSLHKISQHLLRVTNGDVKICPKIADFVFANRNEGSSFIHSIDNDQDSSLPGLRASAANSKTSFVFDMNAEIEDEPTDDVGNVDDHFFGNDICDDDVDDDEMQKAETVAKKSLIRAVNLEGMMDLMKVLSDNPTEYSYFNKKLMCTWAGPMHWKANPFLKFKRSENKLQNGATSTKKTRLKKQDREVDFSGDLITKAEEPGKNLQLKVLTMKKWAETVDNILPDDHCYDPKSLTVPFNKPFSTFGSLKSSKDIPEVAYANSSNGQEYSVPGSPEIGDGIGSNDYDEDFPTEAYGEVGSQNPTAPQSAVYNTSEQLPFVGDNLVAQPEAIEKIDLKYAKVAKKMDVKRLKRAMWDILTATPCNTPTSDAQSSEMAAHVSFNELYRNVPRKITPSMVNNLSAPIAFVTLLHLANEKNLRLNANTQMTDFDICQENKFSL